jgi:hypothetical protein
MRSITLVLALLPSLALGAGVRDAPGQMVRTSPGRLVQTPSAGRTQFGAGTGVVEAEGSRLAYALGLRGSLGSRVRPTALGAEWQNSVGPATAASFYGQFIYLSDVAQNVRLWPAVWTAAKARALLDAWGWADAIAGDSAYGKVAWATAYPDVPARGWSDGAAFGGIPAGFFFSDYPDEFPGGPTMCGPAYFVLAMAEVYGAGDATVYAAYKTRIKSGLDSLPRGANGLLYSDPASMWSEDDWTSGMHAPGEGAYTSAMTAYAYGELGRLASAEGDAAMAAACASAKAAIFAGMASLRLGSDLYAHSSGDPVPSLLATAWAVKARLAATAELAASVAALVAASEVADGLNYQRGHWRFLLYPNYWATQPAGWPADAFVNGGLWAGPTSAVMNEAVATTNEARAEVLGQDLVDMLLTEYTVDGGDWWESINAPADLPAPHDWVTANRARTKPVDLVLSNAGLRQIIPAPAAPSALAFDLNAGNGYEQTILTPHGHEAYGLAFAGALPGGVQVTLYDAARAMTDLDFPDPSPLTYGTENAILSSVTGDTSIGARPLHAYGRGYLKVKVTAGAPGAPITGTILQGVPPAAITLSAPTLGATVSDPTMTAGNYTATGTPTFADGLASFEATGSLVLKSAVFPDDDDYRLAADIRPRGAAATSLWGRAGVGSVVYVERGTTGTWQVRKYQGGSGPSVLATLGTDAGLNRWYRALLVFRGTTVYASVVDVATDRIVGSAIVSAGTVASGYSQLSCGGAVDFRNLVAESITAVPTSQPVPPAYVLAPFDPSAGLIGAKAAVTGNVLSASTLKFPLRLYDHTGVEVATSEWPPALVQVVY